jgi:hypothetical protein
MIAGLFMNRWGFFGAILLLLLVAVGWQKLQIRSMVADYTLQAERLKTVSEVAEANKTAVEAMQRFLKKQDEEITRLRDATERQKELVAAVTRRTKRARETNEDRPAAPFVRDAIDQLYAPRAEDSHQDTGGKP